MKIIEGFNKYMASEDGQIWSIESSSFIKQGKLKAGYCTVRLINDAGKTEQHLVHRLIAKTFIDNPFNKPEVDHINRNPSDNRLENIRWATRKENLDNRDEVLVRNHCIKICQESNNKRKKKVLCHQNSMIYESLNEASRILNINVGSIKQVCDGKYKQAKNYTFSYYSEVK